jgi:hypothetical protein
MLRIRFASRLLPFAAASSLAAALVAACDPGHKHEFATTSTSGAGGSTGASVFATSSSSGMGGDVGIDGGPATSTGTSIGLDAGCAGTATKAEKLPLDIFIMLDQSGSMSAPVAIGGTRWDAVTAALTSFVQQTFLTDVSVGLQYFGLPPSKVCPPAIPCSSDSDCTPGCGGCNGADPANNVLGTCGAYNLGDDSCDAADYAVPDVEIAPLPGVGPAIVASMSAHFPSTGTPTSAALQGAIDHASAWATAHPQHVTIVILATDGFPSECDTTIAHLKAIAAAGANGTPKILTFTIGVGDGLFALNEIAEGGGTVQAYVVDNAQDTSHQFLAALDEIRGSALGCTFKIPVPQVGTPDYGAVNVQYTPSGGSPGLLPQVADEAHCPATGDAWHYDNPTNPSTIVLCKKTCTKVSNDGLAEIDVVLGCATIVK